MSQPKCSQRIQQVQQEPNNDIEVTTTKTTATRKDDSSTRLAPEGDMYSPLGSKTDCVALLIHCPVHDMVLVRQQSAALWMPFTHLQPNRSWKDSVLIGFCLTMSGPGGEDRFERYKDDPPCEMFKCMQVFRVQLPQTRKFFTRLVYYFRLRVADNDIADIERCCRRKIAPHLVWLPLREIQAGLIATLWGPELVMFGNSISPGGICDTEQTNKLPPNRIAEFSLEEAFHFVPRDPPRNLEEDMLKSLHITEKVVERLYAHFLDHCYPSFYLTVDSFRAFMIKHQFEKAETRLLGLFRAFNYDCNGYVSFHEFLMGLACMEPSVQHGEFRAKFIFRYYDVDRSGTLSTDELRLMVNDLCSADQRESKLQQAIDVMGTIGSDGKPEVTRPNFVIALGSLRFRGTSILCRSSKSIFAQISQSMALKAIDQTGSSQKMLGELMLKRKYVGVCKTCAEKRYEVANHIVTFDIAGYCSGKLRTLEQSVIDEANNNNKNTNTTNNNVAVCSAWKYSIECVFNTESAANRTIRLVREFNLGKRNGYGQTFGILQDQKETLWSLLSALHREIDVLLDAEEKCQRVFSPCFVMGDIHGNLEDLLSLEKALWMEIPCVGGNYLFLGDYVDRGHWGFECALYLIAFKILCPNKVTLLRGNHEVRTLQTHYTYQRECRMKYGEEYGLKLWELSNRIFDKFPVCAMIDEAIYAAHGGIPRSTVEVEQICKMKRELCDPEHESTIAWEILWSDPAHMQTFFEAADLTNQNPNQLNGFVRNIKRGTAFLFNEDGANHFLAANGLTHIIRAHEVPPAGFTFHFGNKCATIFSCSHYCGNDNESACIFADNQRLRVVQLDTVNNLSATDIF